MITEIVALLMFVGPDIKEHRIQVDPNTGKPSMHLCMKHKREASRPPISENISYKCICLLYTSPSPRDRQKSRMPSSA